MSQSDKQKEAERLFLSRVECTHSPFATFRVAFFCVWEERKKNTFPSTGESPKKAKKTNQTKPK